eukprot:CAMPEP_0195299590 /NCGR_PEP_ID=MMETSP0707-20130614/25817_1 /TAXON_ID=33640 /ORGANISM="Asterionellopsis glacialis, Strain CCMP134" /LENGTH=309 /DNA_ID=CAMNT_0040362029 /DNA_START=125 /DNA_END=1054 /DNA_ORIENTATION=+
MAGPSQELAASSKGRKSRGQRLAQKKFRLEQQIQDLKAGVLVGASTRKGGKIDYGGDDSHYNKQNNEEQEILRDDIRTVSILSPNRAAIELINGTTVHVNPQTLHQRDHQDIWLAVRSALLVTASEFSSVLGTSFFTTRDELMEIKLGKRSGFNGNAACTWGLRVESTAFRQYVEATKNNAQETGLHIHPNGLYGASPDGLVIDRKDGSEGLLEIKCMYGKRTKKKMKQYEYCPRRFYDQIQGQMAICDRPWCDLIIWIPKNSKAKNYSILRVHRNETYWNERLSPELETFCEEVAAFKEEEEKEMANV